MLHVAYLMPLLPLAGFVVLAAFGRRLGDPVGRVARHGHRRRARSSSPAWSPPGSSATRRAPARTVTQNLFTWIPVGGLQVHAALLIDPLSMTMALFVTGVSALIHLYSIGYMKGDPDYPKFFVYLNLFVASMLILVLADNLLFTFVGLGGRGGVLVLAGVVLVRPRLGGQRGQEGVHLQPARRRRVPPRHVPGLQRHRAPSTTWASSPTLGR